MVMMNGAAFEHAICEALGIDMKNDKVLGIDINIRSHDVVTVQITRILLTDEGEKVTQLLRGVKWELVEDVKE